VLPSSALFMADSPALKKNGQWTKYFIIAENIFGAFNNM
jgi:hypothetical protein